MWCYVLSQYRCVRSTCTVQLLLTLPVPVSSSTLEYIWPLRRGLLTLPVLSVRTPFVLWFYGVNMTQWTPKDGMGTLEYCLCKPSIGGVTMARRHLVLQYCIPAAEIDSGLQPSSPCSSSLWSLPVQASTTNKLIVPRPSPPTKLNKTPISVNPLPLEFVVYVVIEVQQTSLNMVHLQVELLGAHKRMGDTSCKDDLIVYSPCI